MQQKLTTLLSLLLAASAGAVPQDFAPNWKALNGRKPPAWFGEAKFGISVHWGVYSVPAFAAPGADAARYGRAVRTGAHGGLEKRFHEERYGADFGYEQLAPLFEAELFDPAQWASTFARSGARYVVLSAKDHDGFCLWPSDVASEVRGYPWNSAQVGPKRDIVGELTEAVRAKGLRMGLSYSLMEWSNPLYDGDVPSYVNAVALPQIKDLVTRYEPDLFWSDGDGEHPDTTWRGAELLAWLYNGGGGAELVVNDRWGAGLRGQVGDFYTHDAPASGARAARRPWEQRLAVGGSSGYNRAADHDVYATRTDAVRALIDAAAAGGNLLLDVGPTADGRIPPIVQDRLFAIGRFLETNGEAIYGTQAGPFQRLPWGTSTRKGNTIYLFVYDFPVNSSLIEFPGLETVVENAYVLGDPARRRLPVVMAAPGRPSVHMAGQYPLEFATVIALELAEPPIVRERFSAGSDRVVRLDTRFGELGTIGAPDAGGEAPRLERFKGATLSDYRGDVTTPDMHAMIWKDTSGTVTWEPVVLGAGAWTVELVYSCPPGAEGSTYLVTIGGASVQGKVEPTSGATDFVTRPVGTIQIGTTGEVEASLRLLDATGKGPAMTVESVHLAPIGSRR